MQLLLKTFQQIVFKNKTLAHFNSWGTLKFQKTLKDSSIKILKAD